MPVVDGQWFLYEEHNGKQLCICPVCRCIMSVVRSPFCVAFKTGPFSEDFISVRSDIPTHRDLTLIDIFKICGKRLQAHTRSRAPPGSSQKTRLLA
eukprot:7419524-Karenia_brevis.AAC.1